MVVTLLPPDAGKVTVCGHDVVRAPMAARRCLGYAPEEPLVYGGLTPLEFCELAATLHPLAIVGFDLYLLLMLRSLARQAARPQRTIADAA